MEIKAEMNHGRWIVRCPKSPTTHAVQVFPGHDFTFVCGECYHNLNGSATRIPDSTAFSTANAAGNVHTIVWPDNLMEIEQALNYRLIENSNWLPGETVEYLQNDNVIHGVGPTLPQVSIANGGK
jgi:hypothetical protein